MITMLHRLQIAFLGILLLSEVTSGSVVATVKNKVLVLGGTGFVGSKVVENAISTGWEVVSLSRRGTPKRSLNSDDVTWLAGDASDKDLINDIFLRYGPFDACVHAVGLLLDAESGLSSLNKYASGSGSAPSDIATYDLVTRQTAYSLLDTIENQKYSSPIPLIFISAAEAGWDFEAPVPWLEKYLIAKRQVETRLLRSNKIRPVIFRPSLVWTWERPQALVSVIPFIIGSKFLSFVDKPVMLESLVNAIIASIKDKSVIGIKTWREIEELVGAHQK